MGNFIYGANCCCSIGNKDGETLRIEKVLAVVRQDTGKEVDFGWGVVDAVPENTVLVTKTKWVIRKDFSEIARFDTEAEAKAELKRIVDELAEHNVVVRV